MTQRLGPLEVDPSTKEPFLRLRRHSNIIITPPRLTDVPFIVPPMNDERVYKWLVKPPYPYYEEHARQFIDSVKPDCDQGLKELAEASGTEEPAVLTHCPVIFLREVQEDGSDIFLGVVSFGRCGEVETLMENPKHTNEANLALPAGHPEIVWTIGNFLMPSHHGRGIMTDTIDTLISSLARPYMGVRSIVAGAFFGNEGSMRVFLKNGFRLTRRLVDHIEVRGKVEGLNVFECHYI